MQPAPGPLSEQPQGDAPLPPVLTRHPAREQPADAERLAAPFVAGPGERDGGAREWTPSRPGPREGSQPASATPGPAHAVEGFLPVGAAIELPYAEPSAADDWVTAESEFLAPAETELLPAFTAPALDAEPWTEFSDDTFPLDAFIRPEDAPGATPALEPTSGQRELAEAAAERLEALAARLRAEGFDALLRPGPEARPIDVLLASVLSGYIAR